MFAITHCYMTWIYNCKCVHLDERRSSWKLFEESNENHNHSILKLAPDYVQIKHRAAYHREHSCMNLKTKMALHVNQKSIIIIIFFFFNFFIDYIFVLLVLETLTTSSQDELALMNTTHETFTQCVQIKSDIQETFENESINTFHYKCHITNM